MPALHGLYNKHPITGEEGIWLDLCTGPGLVGISKAQYNTLAVGVTKQQFETVFNSVAQKLCEVKSNRLQSPVEKGCRVENGEYVAQIVKFTAKVRQITPTIEFDEITVEEAASRAITV